MVLRFIPITLILCRKRAHLIIFSAQCLSKCENQEAPCKMLAWLDVGGCALGEVTGLLRNCLAHGTDARL